MIRVTKKAENRGARFLIVLPILVAVAAVSTSAEENPGGKTKGETPSYTISQAVDLAFSNNEDLKQAAIALEARRRAMGRSWNSLLPSISASGGVQTPGTSTLSSSGIDGILELSASLSLSASLADDMKLEGLNYAGQLLSYEKTRRNLEVSVKKAYFTILLDQGRVDLERQNIARESESYQQTEKKNQAGLASELDLLSAKVSLEKLKPTLASYEATLAEDMDTLKSYMGIAPETEIRLSGSLSIDKAIVDKLVLQSRDRAAGTSIDVASKAKTLEIDKVTKSSLVKSKLLPSLSLSGSVTPVKGLQSSNDNYSSLSASALLTLRLDNFLPGSSASESIAEAQDDIATAESSLRAAITSTLTSRNSDRLSILADGSSIDALNLNIELCQKTYDASKEAYQKGYSTLTDLETAAGNLDSAKIDLLSKLYDLSAALLDLVNETGLALDF